MLQYSTTWFFNFKEVQYDDFQPQIPCCWFQEIAESVRETFHSDRIAGRNCDHHYPAGAEFLTFASFFFLIIKHLWFTILFNGRIFQFFCQNFCSAQFFGVLDGVDAKKAEISRSRFEVKSALFRIVFNITVLSNFTQKLQYIQLNLTWR